MQFRATADYNSALRCGRSRSAIWFVLSLLAVVFTVTSARAASLTYDFVWRHSTQGYDALWIMDGVDLDASAALDPDPETDLDWKIVGTGDFNRDGHRDLVWHHADSGQIKLWYMEGENRTLETDFDPDEEPDLDWRIVGVADFNQDNKPDLLWQHADGWIVIWYMDGVNLITPTETSDNVTGDPDWLVVGTGDFNYDGRPDILFQHQGDGDIAIWHMNGRTLMSATLTDPDNPGTLDWKIVDSGDMNGDGKADLVWQHTDSTIAVWYMNGASLTVPTLTDPDNPGDVNWRIVATGEFTLASADTDTDGLPDDWETTYFGNLNQAADDDPDGDGLTNLQEFRNQSHPNEAEIKITIGKPNSKSRIP